MDVSGKSDSTPIQDYYNGANIFVTGVTGFLGKALVEKLLRSCHGINRIYYLIRTKKQYTITDRHNQLLSSEIFNKLRNKKPETLNKLFPMFGDLREADFGLSEENRKILIEEVNIIFHSAATIRFDERLDIAFKTNTLPTKRLLELGKTMKQLKCIAYVSTAYSNCDMNVIEERVYPPPITFNELSKICESTEENFLNKCFKKIAPRHPNTYTFTKKMTESVAKDMPKSFKMCIVRPSIITSSKSDPIPGWIDSYQGPSSMTIAIGKGIVKAQHAPTGNKINVIPIDIAVNTLIAACWKTSLETQEELSVYNCTMPTETSLTWHEYGRHITRSWRKLPPCQILDKPSFVVRSNLLVNILYYYLLQLLPCLLYDFFRILFLKKPLISEIMMKCRTMCGISKYFFEGTWIFRVEKMIELRESITDEKDKADFDLELSLDYKKYLYDYVYGLRRYVLKEDPSTIPEAIKKMNKRSLNANIFKIFSITLLVYIVFAIYRKASYYISSIAHT